MYLNGSNTPGIVWSVSSMYACKSSSSLLVYVKALEMESMTSELYDSFQHLK